MSKVWFVTGASRGIGASMVRAALNEGHRVVATGRDVAAIRQAFAAQRDRVLPLGLDVAQEAQAQAAVAQALEQFGRIDVLVNNAGYGQLGLFEEVEPQAIARQFETNVFGLMHVTRAVLPAMRRQRQGHVFNLASVGGVVGFSGASIYCATKFAVAGFTESLADELAPFGIKVTVVEPGFTRTDFLDGKSVLYGTRHVPDYAEASARTRAAYDQHAGAQRGDPEKLARVLLQVAGMEQPPLHLLTGSDAVTLVEASLARRDTETKSHAKLSSSVDMDERSTP